jgi:hypothetical protein
VTALNGFCSDSKPERLPEKESQQNFSANELPKA